MGKGGIVSGRVHPRIKQILRGVKQESKLRHEGVLRFNKRWRSWAIRTVRQQVLPKEVVITSDPSLMDSEYLSTCIYKAACSGLKDIDIWRGYEARLTGIVDEIPGQYMGYIMWGLGKVQYKLSNRMMDKLAERIETLMGESGAITSFGIMASLWTFKRALYKPSDSLLTVISNRLMEKPEKFRPSDYIRICNCLGYFGFRKSDNAFRDRISSISMAKFENEVYAQDFRDVVDHVTLVNLWNDEMRGYILERFRNIMITARPNHLLKAYQCAVAVRVLAPDAWYDNLSEKARGFYTSLAMRHIAVRSREMSLFHRQVSDVLATSDQLGIEHRNMFRWGPFWIDIGIEGSDNDESLGDDDKKQCIILDKQTSYWANRTREYTEKSRIESALLNQVGWKVAHVNFRDWKASTDRVALLKSVLS